MESNYKNYQSMVTAVTTGINRLDGVCRHLSMDAQADDLNSIGERLENHIFSVGIMGEFKRGKSTVINAMLGSEIVPADIMPCSATLNYIKWDASKHARVRFKDGTTKDIPVEELSDYITKITEESERQAENVEDATVYYPCRFCQNGVQIIDTPGLNDDERMNAISESVIPTLDAIIMVTVPGSPFGISEAEFVRNKIMTSDLGRIIFVVNKIDTVDEDERDRIINHIKSKIKTSVLEKMKAVYGEDSEEYRGAMDKLAGIRIIGVSAKQALKGKLKDDQKLLEQSGFPAFEDLLSKLLTEERGLLELIHPVNQIMSTGRTSLETIENRLNALNMDAEEFKMVQKESISKIKETRKKKKEEIKALKAKGKTLYIDLLPRVDSAYEDVKNAVFDYVGSIPITEESCANQAALDAFSEKVNGDIQKQIEDSFSIATERLMNEVDTQLGKDVERLKSFGNEFNSIVQGIHLELNTASSSKGISSPLGSARDALIETGIMYGAVAILGDALPGVGGLISGWRDHGLKGALVGGVSGYGIGMLAATVAGAFLPVGLPLILITGIASTFGGKMVTNLIFGRKKKEQKTASAEDIRTTLFNSAEKCIDDLRSQQYLEKWLKEFCETSYQSVAENIDQEWENTLVTLEGSLSQIEADIKMNESNKKNVQDTMNDYVRIINEVMGEVQPVRDRLSSALNEN